MIYVELYVANDLILPVTVFLTVLLPDNILTTSMTNKRIMTSQEAFARERRKWNESISTAIN